MIGEPNEGTIDETPINIDMMFGQLVVLIDEDLDGELFTTLLGQLIGSVISKS